MSGRFDKNEDKVDLMSLSVFDNNNAHCEINIIYVNDFLSCNCFLILFSTASYISLQGVQRFGGVLFGMYLITCTHPQNTSLNLNKLFTCKCT